MERTKQADNILYVEEGWKDDAKSYFCPGYCKGRNASEIVKDCDKERFYLQQYPTVKAVVDAGVFPSGKAHYDKYHDQHPLVWSCLQKHHPKSLGDNVGCRDMWTKFINNTYEVVKTWTLLG